MKTITTAVLCSDNPVTRFCDWFYDFCDRHRRDEWSGLIHTVKYWALVFALFAFTHQAFQAVETIKIAAHFWTIALWRNVDIFSTPLVFAVTFYNRRARPRREAR